MKNKIFLVVLSLILVFSATGFSLLAKASVDKEDKGPLTKTTFIHYKKNPVKPNGNPAKVKTNQCYTFLASGAKWKVVEDYFVNPTNSNLDGNFVFSAINAGVAEWEKYGGEIFGNAILDETAIYQDNVTDGKNVVAFGDYPDSNVIAITTVWGYFSGAPKTRQLVEWDMLFNTQFNWGEGEIIPALMDVQNIATHELGHSAGMGDLYQSGCVLETMYGYSTEGEISKRDLYNGDILGIQALY